MYEFREIKNRYVKCLREEIEKISSTSDGNIDINALIIIMRMHPTFVNNPKFVERFWELFVVDAFIGNHDRNNGNLGILFNKDNSKVLIAPVYDNGSSFSNSMDLDRMKKVLCDNERFFNFAYNSVTSAFFENDKIINPFKCIEKLNNLDLNDAIKRIVPKIDLIKIKEMIYEIPSEYNNIKIIDDIQKNFILNC